MTSTSERRGDLAGFKRKSAMPLAPSQGSDGPASKRRKIVDSDTEGKDRAVEAGNALLERLKNARDKKNWPIATHFLTLPDQKLLPDYYEQIALPIALETIESKIISREYDSVTALESDFKRMISNAKAYNEKTSQVFGDAEKIRKIVSVFMENNNPAYKSPDYHPFPTPLPGERPHNLKKEAEPLSVQSLQSAGQKLEEPQAGRRSGRNAVSPSDVQAVRHRTTSSTPLVRAVEGTEEGFEGNTFQQAQEKIITEIMDLTDDDGNSMTANFLNLPSRALHDYYRVIKHPVCIKSVRKLVLGIKGRDAPTGKTLLKSWDAFENEVSYVWRNAREYNEDGSAIVELAQELESYFKRRLSEAKPLVSEPPQPLKLTMKAHEAPKITLKFGSQRPNGSNGVNVDHSALQRQQRDVNAATSGEASKPASQPVGARPNDATASKTIQDMSSGHADLGPPVQLNGFKRESSNMPSPVTSSSQVNGLGIAGSSGMPPPVAQTSRIPSGSPHPTTTVNGTSHNASHSSAILKSSLRQPGKDASDALITNLNVTTHPDLDSAQKFDLSIPASPTRTEQSVTIKLARRQWRLLITPTLSATLMQRPSKTFVTCNGRRINTLPQPEIDQRRPVYEHKLVPGTNTIELEVIAGLPRGAPKAGSSQELELEKFTVFAFYQQ